MFAFTSSAIRGNSKMLCNFAMIGAGIGAVSGIFGTFMENKTTSGENQELRNISEDAADLVADIAELLNICGSISPLKPLTFYFIQLCRLEQHNNSHSNLGINYNAAIINNHIQKLLNQIKMVNISIPALASDIEECCDALSKHASDLLHNISQTLSVTIMDGKYQ